MTPSNPSTIDEIVDSFLVERRKHQAFADALTELFRRHPVPEHWHEMHHAVRGSALRKAREGGYGGHSWRWRVEENAREDWNVPPEEVVTIHALIYG